LDEFNPDEDKASLESKKNLCFLGFIILKNKLKQDTAYFMTKILESKVDLIISTGDNVFTSISVARECFMIQPNTCLRMIDMDFTQDNKFTLKV
jgi:magnesium-transporting ATPase (P-type)